MALTCPPALARPGNTMDESPLEPIVIKVLRGAKFSRLLNLVILLVIAIVFHKAPEEIYTHWVEVVIALATIAATEVVQEACNATLASPPPPRRQRSLASKAPPALDDKSDEEPRDG